MAICGVNQTIDPRLRELMDKYGQANGVIRFLREKTNPVPITFDEIKADIVVSEGVKVIRESTESGAIITYEMYKEVFGE